MGSDVVRGGSLPHTEEVLRALTQFAIQLSISVSSQATALRPMRTGAGKLASRTRRQTDARDRPVRSCTLVMRRSCSGGRESFIVVSAGSCELLRRFWTQP